MCCGRRPRRATTDATAVARQALAAAQAAGRKVGALAPDEDACVLAQVGAVVYRLGADLNSIARHLYAGLCWLDAQGVEVILCRDVGASGLGAATRDRLTRAAARVVSAE